MKRFSRYIVALFALLAVAFTSRAVGWPANYEGVMLQGFYWDSHNSDTKWSLLEAQADELSAFFKLIWVPNSGKSTGGLGYMPIYWFTNHNSDMGSESQLRSMIKTYKAKGTGIMADLVINHRSGASNWYDFPTETWNGQTWKIGLDGICRNDEMSSQSTKPTGNYDTGENFDGSRDLDHTNANVQNNCKNYAKCLLTDFGYSGYRIDMAKGFSGQYVKTYNQYAKPTYSVGEYWDGSYDALAAWIESTGRESAAFDFAFKYALNNAFSSGDMTKLVWNAGGTTPQPAGLIHYGYQQLAVTFIDNHDTYRDSNKFNGNVVAAHAFMLCSPGTPCVFLPHYKQYKEEIQRLISIRNAVGISNTSSVRVLQTNSSCYMAEVTGSKGKLVVKVGSAMVSPDGYSNSDIVASGNDYCVWTKVKISTPDPVVTMPAHMYLIGDLKDGHWKTNVGIAMTAEGTKFKAEGVELVPNGSATKVYFSFCTALGTTGNNTEWDAIINKSNRYGSEKENTTIAVGTPATVKTYIGDYDASACSSWGTTPGTYDVVFDFAAKTVTLYNEGEIPDDPVVDPTPDPTPDPTTITVYWDNSTAKWTTPHVHYWGGAQESSWPGVAMTKVEGNIWTYALPAGTTGVIFDKGQGAGSSVSGSQTSDLTPVDGHIYNMSGDKGTYTPSGGGQTQDPTPGNYSGYYLALCAEQTGWGFLDENSDAKIGAQPDNDGIATFSVTNLGGYFRIKVWDDNAKKDTYYLHTEIAALDQWTTVDTAADDDTMGSMKVPADAQAGAVVVKVDVANHKVMISKAQGTTPDPQDPEDPTPGDYKKLYLVGSPFGWEHGKGDVEMTTTDGVTYVAKGVTLAAAGDVLWKIWDGTWDYNFGAWADQPVVDGDWTDCGFNAADFTTSSTAPVDIYFQLVKGADVQDSSIPCKIKIVSAGETPTDPEQPEDPTPGDYKKLYLVGSPFSWNHGEGDVEMTTTDGVTYVAKGVTLAATGDVVWKIWDGTWDYNFGAWADQPVVDGDWTECGFNAADFTTSSTAPVDIYFQLVKGADVQDSSIPCKIKIVTSTGGGDDPVVPGNYPEDLYIIGNVAGENWSTTLAVPYDWSDGEGLYEWYNISFDKASDDNEYSYFSLITKLGEGTENDWDIVNQGDRYGAVDEDTEITDSAEIKAYPANVSASGAQSWKVYNGVYNVTVDLSSKVITLAAAGADVEGDVDGDGVVDVNDLGALINIICGMGENTPMADVDANGEVEIADLGMLVNMICGL